MIYSRSGVEILKIEGTGSVETCRATMKDGAEQFTVIDYPINWLKADNGATEIDEALNA